MKNILIVSYTFPPVGGAGVQRVSKFVKYFPRFNWNPVVVTVLDPSVPLKDVSLTKDIDQNIQIIRTKTLEPSYSFKNSFGKFDDNCQSAIKKLVFFVKKILKNALRYLLIPDVQILWWPGAAVALFKELKQRNTDIIFATGPPYSSLLLAVFWGKVFDVPVVVDFRDEWMFSRNSWENAAKGKFFDWCDKKMEGWVVRNASLVTVASPAYRESILNNWRELAQDKVVTITNGYDPDDFRGVIPAQREEDEAGKFVIVYIGTVWKATSLNGFMEALDRFIENNSEAKSKIILKIIGRIVREEESIIAEIEQRISVKKYGYLKHDEAISHMLAADALLLTLATMFGSEKIIPAKTFEYIAVSKPIIAFIPDGACKEILVNASIDKLLLINKISLSIITPNNMVIKTNKKIIDYSRDKLTKKLIDEISKIEASRK